MTSFYQSCPLGIAVHGKFHTMRWNRIVVVVVVVTVWIVGIGTSPSSSPL